MNMSRREVLRAVLGGIASISGAGSPCGLAQGREAAPHDARSIAWSDDMSYGSATELIAALRLRKVSSVELVRHSIARIEALDSRFNAVVARDFEQAIAAARAADEALARGEDKPLLGLPMTVKEAFNVMGLPTTWGIPGKTQGRAMIDAVAVGRLKAAGAIVIGKTNVPLMLTDWQSYNVDYGVTNNPWDVARTPGGSSGGAAAALAAGYVPLELGSDIAGSLRVPAAFCGVFAHKPTWNLIPMRGAVPPGAPVMSIAAHLDLAVAGPMARSADDLALALAVTAGPDDADAVAYSLRLPAPRHARLSDFRVFVIDEHPLLPTENGIRAALASFADRLAKAGCKVGRVEPKLPDLATIGVLYETLLMSFVGADMPDDGYAQAQAATREASVPSLDRLSAAIARGLVLTHRDWIRTDRIRTGIADRWRTFFRDWDAVICPVMPTVAFPHDHREMKNRDVTVDGTTVPYIRQAMWVGIATLTGQPATAVPIGTNDAGLPIGLQIMGPYLEDATTIALAQLIEHEFGGFKQPPALPQL
jgi:amidase